MKKILAIIFCIGNIRVETDIDKDIINIKDFADNNMAENENLTTNQAIANTKLLNPEKNAEKFLKKLFATAYETNELVQAIIDAKSKGLQKLQPNILKQVKLTIKDLEVKNDRLYIKNKIYIPNNKQLQLHLLHQHYNLSKQKYSGYKAMF